MKLILLSALATSLFAGFSGSVQVTGTYYTDKPTEDSFHVWKRDIRPVVTLKYYKDIGNFEVKARVSNKLEDTFLEQASVRYATRKNDDMLSVEVGAVDTFEGIFSESYLATEQNPFVFKNHGMYNDEFLAGFLDTTLGTRIDYKHWFRPSTILSFTTTYAKIRELNEKKAEGTFYGYESQYVDMDYSHPITSFDIRLEYLSKFMVFASKVDFEIQPKATSAVPQDRLARYISEGDGSVFVPNTPFDVSVERAGFSYCNTNILFGGEGFLMHIVNEDLKIRNRFKGAFLYLAWYATDELTPYVSYGASTNNRPNSHTYEDKIVGFRYTMPKNTAILVEAKESCWIQQETYQQAKAFRKQDDKDISLIAIKFVMGF